jgi:hypothetical protein
MSKLLLRLLVEKIVRQEASSKEPYVNSWDSASADFKSLAKSKRKLRVFDFDDTLVKTQSKVRLKKSTGEVISLTPAQYARYERQPGDEFDYTDFEVLVDPAEIAWMTRILRKVINKRGTNAAVILTARGNKKPVEEFLAINGIPKIPIVALGDSDPQAKAQWILYVIKKLHYDIVEFFDDSPKNIKAVENLQPLVPNTKIIARLIKHIHPRHD